jgi:hypothetical protein
MLGNKQLVAKNLLENKTCADCLYLDIFYETYSAGINRKEKTKLTCSERMFKKLPKQLTCRKWKKDLDAIPEFVRKIRDKLHAIP